MKEDFGEFDPVKHVLLCSSGFICEVESHAFSLVQLVESAFINEMLSSESGRYRKQEEDDAVESRRSFDSLDGSGKEHSYISA